MFTNPSGVSSSHSGAVTHLLAIMSIQLVTELRILFLLKSCDIISLHPQTQVVRKDD